MPPVAFRFIETTSEVAVAVADAPSALRSELEYTLMLAGGAVVGTELRIPGFAFRRASTEVARILQRHQSDATRDSGVERLLRAQLDEIRARKQAESDLAPLSEDQVVHAVEAGRRFVRSLTAQQKQNLGRLLGLGHGANFSVPGAGKTTTLLALYEALHGAGRVDRLLVVGPKNAFLSWEQETAECFSAEDRPEVGRIEGGRRGARALLDEDPEILLVTYQLLPNILDLVMHWAQSHKVHVALDESHRAKAGHSGVYAGAALRMAEVAARRDIMSGTPLPHAPEDLRPQLDFLWPGQRILPDFRLLSDSPPEVISDIERRVRPLYVRTTKAQLNLPPLVPRPVAVQLGPLQRELYELLRSEAARAAARMNTRDRRYFRSLGRQVVRLIQAATNPMLLAQATALGDIDVHEGQQGTRAWELLREIARDERPAKVKTAVQLAEEAIGRGERVVIWSGFIANLHLLDRLLAAHNPVVLFGQVATGEAEDPDTREGRIRRFHEDPSCRVMIANPAAAGEGISLHRTCQYAIYLDRSFNAAHYLQSVDRIHRLGSTKPAHVDILEARGTIDSRIAERLASKIEAMATILNDSGLRALAYDPDDVLEEFEGGIELEDIEEIISHLTGEEDSD